MVAGVFLSVVIKFRDSVKYENLLISSVITNLLIRTSNSGVGCRRVTLYGHKRRGFDVSCSAKLQS